MDDFGTAYSSLNYLHSLPLHKVKIDQSFVQGLGSNQRAQVTLLRGMARLSTQLGLRVVVEGVETEDQLELLFLKRVLMKFKATCFAGHCPQPTSVSCFTPLALILSKALGRSGFKKTWRKERVVCPRRLSSV